MNFTLTKGEDFSESFDFKAANGKPVALPSGKFAVILERGTFVQKYEVGSGLSRLRNSLTWKISDEESNNFQFNTMYYTLYLNDTEVTRGILNVR